MFRKFYQVDNLFLHPEIEITPVRTDRQLYVRDILQKYQVQHHLVLDDEPFWYENQGLNYFQTDTFDGITHKVFLSMVKLAEEIAHKQKHL